jgi:hypothetical protein
MSIVFDEFFPFDPTFGASANAFRWRKMAQLWQADGVRAGWLNQLLATQVGLTITLQPGAVFVHGYYAESTANKTFTGTNNGTLVAQANLVTSAENIQLVYRDGIMDYGASGFAQDATDRNIWEIPLWQMQNGTLVDLRTMINPGGDISWWAQTSLATPIAIGSGATNPGGAGSTQQMLTARVPYAGSALLTGTMLLTFTDLSIAQNAICQLIYQPGVSGEQSPVTPGTTPPGITPAISGGGPVGQSVSIPVALTSWVNVIQGLKYAGWYVKCGAGTAGIQISQMTVSMRLVGVGAAH